MKSTIPNIPSRTTFGLMLALVLFVLPFAVLGATLYQQTDDSTSLGGTGLVTTNLGTGLSGTPLSVTASLGNPSGFSRSYTATLYCYTDSGYTSYCTGGDVVAGGGVAAYSTGSPVTILAGASQKKYDVVFNDSAAFNPTRYYRLSIDMGGSGNVYGNASSVPFYEICDEDVCGAENASTHVISVVPADGEASTSPVTISVDYYITDADATSLFSTPNIGIRLYDVSNGIYAGTDEVLLNASYSSGGHYHYSTTTALTDGNYNIEVSLFGTTLFGSVTLNTYEPNTVHRFTVGSSTPLGDFLQGIAGNSGFVQGFTATSTALARAGCSLTDFQVDNCLVYLFLGNTEQWSTFGSSVRTSLLLKFPWGYITRASDIVFGTASSSLPSLVITAPSGLTGVSGDSIDLTPWVAVASSSEYKATGSSVTWWSVISPYWDLACYSLFGASIFFTALGLLFKRGAHRRR